ncbi:MAG: zinc-dependent metalloprotease [Saprospiraceae bacterium]|nr:zinc-dependent metalloprotease [Saprospiraceae bacterium]
MRKIIFYTLLSCCFLNFSFAQSNTHKPSELVAAANSVKKAVQVSVFSKSEDRSANVPSELVNYELMDLKSQAVNDILTSNNDFIEVSVPVYGRSDLKLELVEVNILSDDGYVIEKPSNEQVKVNHGKHFRGIVKGNQKSLVSISVFENEVMGFISEPGNSNLVIGMLEDKSSHIIYEDKDLLDKFNFDCATPESPVEYTIEELSTPEGGERALSDCVRIYFEVDYDIYLDKGSNITTVTNFITGLFNQVATMYANEQINIVLSPLVIWTQTSPYSSTSSSGMLNDFLANTGAFDGDLAQLLSYQASGGIAYVDQLCSSNPDLKKSFSSIDPTYQNVPVYSWSVMVVTHEFGHLFGSSHTHACAWNGNNTAIDGCYTTEGNCPQPGIPSGGGTVMSYCHLTSAGINLNNGFGPQPGNLIRSRVTNASCLDPCGGGGPTCTDGVQNGNETGVDCGGPDCPACPDPCTDTEATLTLVLDNYPGETTWTLKNAGGTTLYSGGPYSSAGSTVTVDFCLVDGCYDFTINDSYGDGICCGYGQGSYDISIGGQSVASGGAFGSTETKNFCAGGGSGPTCTDGVQNGNETGVDCGGPDCPACPTCNDGVQNGNETDVDCGGPDCPACPTCNDGIQNGNETGVDCGGPDCAPCGGGNDDLFAHYFETGWDGWQDGGSDCYRYSGQRSYEGSYSIRIRDNSGTASAMTSPTYNLSQYSGVEVTFFFYPNSMESGEDFWLRYYDGSSWQTVATFVSGSSFQNNSFYTATVPILSSSYNMASNAQFRFQCDASGNADRIYIDQVSAVGLSSGSLPSNEIKIKKLHSFAESGEFTFIDEMQISPNPALDELRVKIELDTNQELKIQVIDLLGRKVISNKSNAAEGLNVIPVNIAELESGTYFIKVTDAEGDEMIDKFIKIK